MGSLAKTITGILTLGMTLLLAIFLWSSSRAHSEWPRQGEFEQQA